MNDDSIYRMQGQTASTSGNLTQPTLERTMPRLLSCEERAERYLSKMPLIITVETLSAEFAAVRAEAVQAEAELWAATLLGERDTLSDHRVKLCANVKARARNEAMQYIHEPERQLAELGAVLDDPKTWEGIGGGD